MYQNKTKEFKGYRVYVDFPYSIEEVARAKSWGYRYDGDLKLWYYSIWYKHACDTVDTLPEFLFYIIIFVLKAVKLKMKKNLKMLRYFLKQGYLK